MEGVWLVAEGRPVFTAHLQTSEKRERERERREKREERREKGEDVSEVMTTGLGYEVRSNVLY